MLLSAGLSVHAGKKKNRTPAPAPSAPYVHPIRPGCQVNCSGPSNGGCWGCNANELRTQGQYDKK